MGVAPYDAKIFFLTQSDATWRALFNGVIHVILGVIISEILRKTWNLRAIFSKFDHFWAPNLHQIRVFLNILKTMRARIKKMTFANGNILPQRSTNINILLGKSFTAKEKRQNLFNFRCHRSPWFKVLLLLLFLHGGDGGGLQSFLCFRKIYWHKWI